MRYLCILLLTVTASLQLRAVETPVVTVVSVPDARHVIVNGASVGGVAIPFRVRLQWICPPVGSDPFADQARSILESILTLRGNGVAGGARVKLWSPGDTFLAAEDGSVIATVITVDGQLSEIEKSEIGEQIGGAFAHLDLASAVVIHDLEALEGGLKYRVIEGEVVKAVSVNKLMVFFGWSRFYPGYGDVPDAATADEMSKVELFSRNNGVAMWSVHKEWLLEDQGQLRLLKPDDWLRSAVPE
ncbi:MAG: hypothetical protein PF961_13435 [Planctomycetota bacterium]|jgi:hypothetical protein|nr:hypothetical protein [Planctomycetota bacterium]